MRSRIIRLMSDRGFGFIEKCDGHDKDHFFHFSSVQGNAASLRVGDFVVFDFGKTDERGTPAVNVRLENVPQNTPQQQTTPANQAPRSDESRKEEIRYYLPADTAALIPSFKIENTALKTQKYIRVYRDKEKKLKIIEKAEYSDVEDTLAASIAKAQLDILASYVNNHCTTAVLGSPMMLGLGSESVFETGIALHHTYSIPYIPGSSIKGSLRSYIIRDLYASDEDAALSDSSFTSVFGTITNQGGVMFLDAFPVRDTRKKLTLELDIMNPHFSDYYQGKKDSSTGEPIGPTDDQTPIPIRFYSVPKGTRFMFRLVSNKLDVKGYAIRGKTIPELFEEMLGEIGMGGKTSVGYGWFGDFQPPASR